MVRGVALAGVLVVVLLAGCSDDGDVRFPAPPDLGDAPEYGRTVREVPMEGLEGSVLEGRCPDGATELGDSCHVLRIRVDNTGGDASLDLFAGQWSATLLDGRIVDFGEASPRTVQAGRAVEVRVQFTVKSDWPDIATVAFDGFHAYGQAGMPPY